MSRRDRKNSSDSDNDDQQEYRWQYLANTDAPKSDDSAWANYSDEVSAQLEEAYEAFHAAVKKTKKLKEIAVSDSHYVDLSDMTQYAKGDTTRQRAAR